MRWSTSPRCFGWTRRFARRSHPEWTPALAPYVPEPFRELGGYPVIAEPRAAHLAARTLAALWSASIRSSRIATYPSEP